MIEPWQLLVSDSQGTQIFRDTLDKILRDLTIPQNHPVGKVVRKVSDNITKDSSREAQENYDRAMKGVI